MCSYLNYDSRFLTVEPVEVRERDYASEVLFNRVTYNDKPFILTVPEGTKVNIVDTVLSIALGKVVQYRYNLVAPDTAFGQIHKVITRDIFTKSHNKNILIEPKDNWFDIEYEQGDIKLTKGEIIKPYIRFHISEIIHIEFVSKLMVKLVSIEEEMFQLFRLLRLSDFLPEIRFEIMTWILFL